jgi:sugar (pentulose or hexulose) kinase
MTISDYLTFVMTGKRNGDASTAVLTGLYSLPAQSWWPEALTAFGIKREQLSLPLPPGSIGGRTGSQAAELLGLPMGIPFAVGALDHHAAALGSGLGVFADASLSTGTVLAALVLVDKVTPIPGCIHGPHTDVQLYYRLAFDANGAGQLEDYQRLHTPTLGIDDLLHLAEQYSRESSKGSKLNGPLAEHGAAVFALLSKIASSQRGLLALVTRSVPVVRITATGGGARSPFWLQVTADIFGLPVRAVETVERACLGAAMLAAVAARVWPDVTAASRQMLKLPQDYFPKGGRSS